VDRFEFIGRRRIPLVIEALYDKWPNGEWGHLGATNALPGSFESSNMVVYHDGYFGPRRGIKNLTLETSNGAITGMGWRGTPGADLWWIQDKDVYSMDGHPPVTTVSHWTGTLSVTPTEPPQFVEFGSVFSYVTNYKDQTYKFDHNARTVTALSSSPGGRDIAFYGDRMAVGGTQSALYRVFISAVNDPDTWTGGEFFDVPNQSGAVMALLTQRNHLAIWAQNGEWWIVTGALGTDVAFLRRISGGGQHPWVAHAGAAEVLPADDILHIPVDADIPARFTGSLTNRLERMTINHETKPSGVTSVKVLRGVLPEDGVVIFPQTKHIGMYYNEMWSFHDTGLTLTEFAATDEQGVVFLTDGGGVSTPPKIYAWQIDSDQRPGFITDTWSNVGDDSTHFFDAFLNLPEKWTEPGYEVRIRRVIVDFREWDSGADDPNAFTVTCRSISRFKDPTTDQGFRDGTSQSYSAFPDDWTGGIGSSRLHRHVMAFGENNAYGGACQVRISSIGGVAFSAIRAEVEVRYETPRS
jgi:hypothetical protein